jgi:hypothetical protein
MAEIARQWCVLTVSHLINGMGFWARLVGGVGGERGLEGVVGGE